MAITKRNLVFLGPPGVGKGTLADKILAQESLVHISTGNLLRAEVAAGTPLGLEAKKIMEAGGLVSDSLVTEIICGFLAKEETRLKGFILDGFPRNLAQAELLDQALSVHQLKLDAVVCIEAPEAVLIDRLTARLTCPSCGATFNRLSLPPKVDGICDHCQTGLTQRKDDSVETVKSRLAVYAQSTEPLIAYYRKAGLLLPVDGTRKPEESLTFLLSQLS